MPNITLYTIIIHYSHPICQGNKLYNTAHFGGFFTNLRHSLNLAITSYRNNKIHSQTKAKDASKQAAPNSLFDTSPNLCIDTIVAQYLPFVNT